MSFHNIPIELRELDQRWCCWRSLFDGKRTMKVPVNPLTGLQAKTNDLSTWCSFDEARSAFEQSESKYNGIGFLLVEADGYSIVDFDKCITAGNVDNWAKAAVQLLDSFTEISQSGLGLHVIIKTDEMKINGRVHVGEASNLECYFSSRYFCLTGNILPDTNPTIEQRDSQLQELALQYGLGLAKPQPQSTSVPNPSKSLQEKIAIPALELEDHEIVYKAIRMFGKRFKRLFEENDLSEYADDRSRADLAFCTLLARFTNSPDVIQRIWLNTPFGSRDKVLTRENYRQSTINRAIAGASFHRTTRRGVSK